MVFWRIPAFPAVGEISGRRLSLRTVTFLVIALWLCTRAFADTRPAAKKRSRVPAVPTYKYNPETKRCELDGKPGFNEGRFEACGHVTKLDLHGKNLARRDLRGIKIENSNLRDVNLDGANLSGAKIVSSELDGAQLRGAELSFTFLIDTTLTSAKLQGANLGEALIGKIDASDPSSLFKRAEFDANSRLPRWIDLQTNPKSPELRAFGTEGAEKAQMIFDRGQVDQARIDSLTQGIALDDKFTRIERQLIETDLQILDRLFQLPVRPQASALARGFDLIFPPESPSARRAGVLNEKLSTYLKPRIQSIVKQKVRMPIGMIAGNVTIFELLSPVGRQVVRAVATHREGILLAQPVELPKTPGHLIEMYEGYLGLVLTAVDRASTLIHEARHSDCQESPEKVDQWATEVVALARAFNNKSTQANFQRVTHAFDTGPTADEDKLVEELMTDARSLLEKAGSIADLCIYPHKMCKLHPLLKGDTACENTPWGPYMVESIFAAHVAEDCRNCTAKEKELALALKASGLSRLEFGATPAEGVKVLKAALVSGPPKGNGLLVDAASVLKTKFDQADAKVAGQ